MADSQWGEGQGETGDAAVTGSGWGTCAICLEELPEMDLMVHTTCGGTFCHTCLQVSLNLQQYAPIYTNTVTNNT